MKFKYSGVSTPKGPLLHKSGKMVKRPLLAINLTLQGGQEHEVNALLDSGADTTMVNIQYASHLGVTLDMSKPRPINGVQPGSVDVYDGSFTFQIKTTGEIATVPAWYVDSPNVDILI